jgi:hypothetical protein
MLEAVRDHRRVAVHSCHDVGKSFSMAHLMAWWIDSHKPGDAFVVSTAPTFAQVRAILWRELNRLKRTADLCGRMNQTEWTLDGELVAFGRKPADTDPGAFQGIHALYVLVVLDEACGIPTDLWSAAESLATNDDSKIVAIGNPDDPTSEFQKKCATGSLWHVMHIGAEHSPNFTGEEVPERLRKLLISKAWVEERKAEWGEDNPLYIAKVRGLFPEDAEDGVALLSWVKKCQAEVTHPAKDLAPVELGFDVGAGGDVASIRERRGMKSGRVWRSTSSDSAVLVDLAMLAINETGATRVKVDVIGVGWGVAGDLRRRLADLKSTVEVVEVNVAEVSDDPKRFPVLRDQLWWEIGRELSRSRAWDLADLDDRTIAQLVAPRWRPDGAGRIKVEKKEETKKRLKGASPDDADALLLAFYVGRKRPWWASVGDDKSGTEKGAAS